MPATRKQSPQQQQIRQLPYSRHRQGLAEEEIATLEDTVNSPVYDVQNANIGHNYLLSHANDVVTHMSDAAKRRPWLEGKKKFLCWNTNADTLTNELSELTTRVKSAEIAPSIIAITEGKRKKHRYPITAAEFKIEGYDIFTRNIPGHQGRAVIIYTACELRAY